MGRFPRLAAAALAATSFGQVALAQIGYGDHFHSPYPVGSGYTSSGYMSQGYSGMGYTTPAYSPGYSSRYSLYGGPGSLPTYDASYGYGAPGCGCNAATTAPPAYQSYNPGAGYYSAPGFARMRGEMKYDVYTPYGKQEVKYRYHRNGTMSVDIDD